ncbi:DUF7660 family protein [Prosthecobacter dejongeii]|uniref:DUF7660 domain-containing protein n=1 Tax=Prosthecobacter dejongeii TaxID=48465 RepID=A0A7W7YKL8_9BACT|nr:hypothetical protein [Prosthecobacter dejongeii]MBB5037930.1 hypothetical protein [Prosthecobacter dejongeii]
MSESKQDKSIFTRKDFVVFIQGMEKDFRTNHEDWENKDIPSFLDALGRWVEDMDGYYMNHGLEVPKELTWKVLCDIFDAAKIYE